MFKKTCFYLMLVILFSCRETSSKQEMIYYGIDMENTIVPGEPLTIDKKGVIKQNSIIAFKLPNSDTIKLLRVIGSPGDVIEFVNGEIYINNKLYKKVSTCLIPYVIYMKNPDNFSKITKYYYRPYLRNYWRYYITDDQYHEIVKMNIVDSIFSRWYPDDEDKRLIKVKSAKYCNKGYFGPLKVPAENSIIDDDMVSVIPSYLSKNDIGKPLNNTYYFCIGDFFSDSKDSRMIGLIPKSSVIGVINNIPGVHIVSANH